MDPQVVLVLTWVVAGLVVAAYIWFVVWRYRVEQRKKKAQAVDDTAMSDTIARTVARLDREAGEPSVPPPLPTRPTARTASLETPTRTTIASPTSYVAPAPVPSASSTPEVAAPETATPDSTTTEVATPDSTTPAPTGSAGPTVADRLRGISLPHDLVPLTTMAARSAAADRVAFWTNRAPVEVVGPAFADELERLGYSITTLDVQSLAATRGDDHLMVVIHPDGPAAIVEGRVGFSSVPERSVVVEVWVPA